MANSLGTTNVTASIHLCSFGKAIIHAGHSPSSLAALRPPTLCHGLNKNNLHRLQLGNGTTCQRLGGVAL